MTPTQIRMARAGLGWKQADLAEKASVHARTVKMVENGRVAPLRATISGIARALEQAGARLNEDGSVWVPEPDVSRQAPRSISVQRGLP